MASVADTGGTPPVEPTETVIVRRRNPFIPWTGLDPLSLPGIAERRIPWLWALRDRWRNRIVQPWRAVGMKCAGED